MPPNFDFAMGMDPNIDFYYNDQNNFTQPNNQYNPQVHVSQSQHQSRIQNQNQNQHHHQPQPQPQPQFLSHQPPQLSSQSSQPYPQAQHQFAFQQNQQFQSQTHDYQFQPQPQSYPHQNPQNLNYSSYYPDRPQPQVYQSDFNQYPQSTFFQQQDHISLSSQHPPPTLQRQQQQPAHLQQPHLQQYHSSQPQPQHLQQPSSYPSQQQTQPSPIVSTQYLPQQSSHPIQRPPQNSPSLSQQRPPQSSPHLSQRPSQSSPKIARSQPPSSPKTSQPSTQPKIGTKVEITIPSPQSRQPQAPFLSLQSQGISSQPPAPPLQRQSPSQPVQKTSSSYPPQTVNQVHPDYGRQIQSPMNQQPQTVSMSQLEKKRPAPPAVVKPQHVLVAPPKTKPRVLQSVEINSRPKQPVIKDEPRGDSPAGPEWSEPEYKTALTYVADDLLDSARTQPGDNAQYYEKIGVAIQCLESALANLKLQPVEEAQISLQYAQILYDETENYDDAETQLTKAIEIAERHKFVDLKYEMQVLLSKVLYESKPKAALRDIQRMIDDIEAYRHTAWLYIFRWQHAMFSLNSSPPGDAHNAVSQTQKIITLAKQNSDAAVMAFAGLLEARLHLSSSNHDSITNARNSLATTRAMQLNPTVQAIPQLMLMVELVDIACSLREFNVAEADKKSKEVKQLFYESKAHANWRNDNYIYLPVSQKSLSGIPTQTNRHIVEKKGKFYLKFEWLSKAEVEVLVYILCANSVAHRNSTSGEKAEGYVKGGLELVRALQDRVTPGPYLQVQQNLVRNKLLEAHLLFTLCFLLASKGDWDTAWKHLTQITSISEDLNDEFPLNMKSCLLYLKASILQGMGKLTAAMEIYSSPELQFTPQPPSSNTGLKLSQHNSQSDHTESDITRCFRLLAAMNAAFIMQDPKHPQNHQVPSWVNNLQPAVESCGNKAIKSYHELVISVLVHKSIQVKHHLRASLEAGKEIGSLQITTLALICMQDRAFKGQVEERAWKCARAAGSQSRSWQEPLWTHVASGYEADSLEINGFMKLAVQRRQESEQAWERLPEAVKRVKRSTDD